MMIHRLRRLFRTRLWDIVVSILGLLSFSVYFLHQSGALQKDAYLQETSVISKTSEGRKRTRIRGRRGNKTDVLLLHHLKKLEEQLIESRLLLQKTVLVAGEPGVIGRDLPLYHSVLKQRGYTVRVKNPFNNLPDVRGNWTILLCLSYGDGVEAGCWEEGDLSGLKRGQKVNRITGMRNVLWRKDALCYSLNEARRVPALRRDPVSPPCWVLPSQFDQFLGVADALGSDVRWIFKSPTPGGTKQILQPTKDSDYFKVKQYYSTRAIVQQFFPNPLLFKGRPVSVQLYALVTSINPLRLFLHSEGFVQYRFSYIGEFKKIPDETVSLSKFFEYLTVHHGHSASTKAWEQVKTLVAKTFLISEPFLAAGNGKMDGIPGVNQRFKDCFQLVSVDVIFNSTLHPVILEVNGQPALPTDSPISNRIISDTISVLLAEGSVHEQLFEDLQKIHDMKIGIKIENSDCCGFVDHVIPRKIVYFLGEHRRNVNRDEQGVNCHAFHISCLSTANLEYLIITRQQFISRGSYHQIYPSAKGRDYSAVMRDIHRSPLQQFSPDGNSHFHKSVASAQSTLHLNPILTALQQNISSNEMKHPHTIQLRPLSGNKVEGQYDNDTQNVSDVRDHSEDWVENNYPQIPCSHDDATMPLLSAIYTDPPVNFTPTFDPETTDYYANVPHNLHSIRVWGVAMSCRCEARSNTKHGSSRPCSYTLGVGVNRIALLSVDVTHTLPWVISTYTVHIARQGQDEVREGDIDEYEVCSFTQDCKLKFLDSNQCGLQPLQNQKWKDFIDVLHKLPYCRTADADGRWLVPCGSCSSSSSCDWSKSKWQPYHCQYREMTFHEGQKCLAGKRILFIGDSTNRGIMYYLMQCINGTLQQWDKTHQIRSYSNLNNNSTITTFAYYPQFWLPDEDRPAFDATVHDVISHSQPLQNNGNTILVVGGVHWLAPAHLTLLEAALERDGLSKIQRVLKTLGAGFHQPVDGVHNLTLEEQKSLFHHNQELSQFASSRGYKVVDTFNMTMARFTEFRPGSCACHFHEVVEKGQYMVDAVSKLNLEDKPTITSDVFQDPGTNDAPPSYSLVGRINAMYSEMLLSTICGVS